MSHTQRTLNRLKVWDKYNETIKKYRKQPIIRKVDIEELKKQFSVPVTEEAPIIAKKSVPVVEGVAVDAPLVSAE